MYIGHKTRKTLATEILFAKAAHLRHGVMVPRYGITGIWGKVVKMIF